MRVASLNVVSQAEFMKFVVVKEREEKLPFLKGIIAPPVTPRNK
jgi:hypothetical protein